MSLGTETREDKPPGEKPLAPTSKPLLARILGRLGLAILFAIIAMAVFIKLAHEVGEGETRQIDGAAMLYFRTHHNPLFFSVMTAVSWLAGPIFQSVVLIGCVAYFAATKRFRPQGLTMLIGGIGGALLIVGLKRLFHRPRPEVIFQHLGYSFPSGHSFFAVIVYGMLAYWLTQNVSPRRRRLIWDLAVAGILLVGFSRVFIGEHYPSDVVAGFLVALPWVWGCLAMGAELRRRVHASPRSATGSAVRKTGS